VRVVATPTGTRPAPAGIARRNHYVPIWYQRRFLPDGETHFHYLDLAPDTVVSPDGKSYRRRALLRWGPKRCFVEDDIYTVKLGAWSNDEIERRFFGRIDARGEKAVEFFSDFGMRKGMHEPFDAIVPYMDAQRFRSPRGIDYLKSMTDIRDQNLALFTLQAVYLYNATMWTEGVWEIVSARQSPTKFLLTDEPVSFYNAGAFPGSKDCLYPNDVALKDIGTRTIFALGRDDCLIITHTQLVRDPWTAPRRPRANARAYKLALAKFTDFQFGRELEEDEVLRINVILKKRATRYIAAANEERLYPERRASTTHWSKIDHDWFLLPNPYLVKYGGEIIIGYQDGGSWATDEYGRNPGHPNYDKREVGWDRHLENRAAWAAKRAGRSFSRTVEHEFDHEFMKEDMERFHRPRARRRHGRVGAR
jgi:Protein of unknown function (DUF4238)